MYLRLTICVLALSLAPPATAWGDTVVLSDGDNLSGRLTEISNGLVRFFPDAARSRRYLTNRTAWPNGAPIE